jgi:hypothetical protein
VPVIIDDGGVINDGGISLYAYAIVIYPWRSNVLPVNKTPVIGRWVITTERKVYVNAELGSQRGPAIIITACAPANPCGRPFIARHPKPAIIIIIEPAAIVKRPPAPLIIRGPHPSVIIGKDPTAVCVVRPEIGTQIRAPNISIFRILDPVSIWLQLVVECLVGNLHRYLGSSFILGTTKQ